MWTFQTDKHVDVCARARRYNKCTRITIVSYNTAATQYDKVLNRTRLGIFILFYLICSNITIQRLVNKCVMMTKNNCILFDK